MGGIDLLGWEEYLMSGRTGKWTVRAIFYFDFAAASAWIELRAYLLYKKNKKPWKKRRWWMLTMHAQKLF